MFFFMADKCIIFFFISSKIMELKRSHRTTDLAQRHRFVKMWLGGNSARTIAQYTGASATTVCRWIRRWKIEGHLNLRHRRGKPKNDARLNILPRRTILPCHVAIWTPADFFGRCPNLNHHLSTNFGLYQREKHSYIPYPYSLLYLGSVLSGICSAGGRQSI